MFPSHNLTPKGKFLAWIKSLCANVHDHPINHTLKFKISKTSLKGLAVWISNLWTKIILNNIKHKYTIYGISPQFGAGQAIYYPSYHPTSFQQIWFPINDLNSIMFFPTLDKTFIIVTSILWNEKIKNQNFWDTFSKYKRYS